MNTIEHAGMEIEFSAHGGEQATRECPGEDPYVEVESVRVSDWDEFAECWGAKGTTPIFAPSLDAMLDIISDRDHDAISDAAWVLIGDDEPDCDDGDDYWDDHDIYGGGGYIG